MRETALFAHSNGAIMVDPNELNWVVLILAHDPRPRVLDVDSWVIGGRIPSHVAIMPSIRDWHGGPVSETSDWFAWGVVTFQIYSGIHPYKGTLDGYKPSEMERRMKENLSVFARGVRLNRAVRDFSCIPPKLLRWYEGTFQHGQRVEPPSPFDTVVTASKVAQVLRAVTTATGLLVYEKLFTANDKDPAVRVFPCGVALLMSGRLIDLATKREIGRATSRECEVVKVNGYWLKADKIGSGFNFTCINGTSLNEESLELNALGSRLIRYENRLFLITDQGLTELHLRILGRPILSAGQTWGVMINSTRWFDGVGIQDAMGATFVIAPFSDASVAQVRVRELDGLTSVTAKAGNRFVSVIAVDASGQYVKVELTFDRDYRTYSVWRGGAQIPDLNMALLPKGVGATIVDDGELVIFVPTNGTVNKLSDKDIATDMVLGNWGDKVVVIWNGDVWSIRMS